MSVLPPALIDLIEAFRTLPGVGPRSAERYAYFAFKHPEIAGSKLAGALSNLDQKIKYCPKTFALISNEQKFSNLYTNPSRDRQVVAVVADPFDVVALESTGLFNGTYHVLGGLISPIDGVGPESLHIQELIKRIAEDKVKELIMAINASVEGESTALYIKKMLGERKIKITRLARGLPIGLDLEYADQITLSKALEGRQLL